VNLHLKIKQLINQSKIGLILSATFADKYLDRRNDIAEDFRTQITLTKVFIFTSHQKQ